MNQLRLWMLSIALAVTGCATRLDSNAVCPMVPDGGPAVQLDMGCTAGSMFQNCEVDDNNHTTCTQACSDHEYTLYCFGFSGPQESLACRQIIAHPPAGESFFCCPCQ